MCFILISIHVKVPICEKLKKYKHNLMMHVLFFLFFIIPNGFQDAKIRTWKNDVIILTG